MFSIVQLLARQMRKHHLSNLGMDEKHHHYNGREHLILEHFPIPHEQKVDTPEQRAYQDYSDGDKSGDLYRVVDHVLCSDVEVAGE
jgi:hypothetical protein